MTDAAEPYLIAHLVRGQPAFDIATRCDDMGTASDPGPWWIIPTSGHRAYPYWHQILASLYHADDKLSVYETVTYHTPIPSGWPDHYSPSAAPRGQGLITNLAEKLGFVKKPSVSRR